MRYSVTSDGHGGSPRRLDTDSGHVSPYTPGCVTSGVEATSLRIARAAARNRTRESGSPRPGRRRRTAYEDDQEGGDDPDRGDHGHESEKGHHGTHDDQCPSPRGQGCSSTRHRRSPWNLVDGV
ncbi:hypothetical protein GCM10010988_23860 [Cnuibacter physcomitrellae]|nr:hypothetical protein GCM10010988_23860 [Cnuibacter physcomitrellae]